uniref:Galectin n=3 Tax=Wuchereria bancrofti TaxID=6293 RepID=A0AAF5RW24_WUCBA
MRCYSVLSVFLVSAFVIKITVANRPFSCRGYSEIDERGYMKIYAKDGIQPGEQIRLLVRRFPNVNAEAFDIIQIGYLEEGRTLDLSHGGGDFLPEYPFWFDREKYLMSMRIIHWIYEKRIVVTRKLYNSINFTAIGTFQEPEQFFYTYEGYYTEIIYVIGYPDQVVDHSHYFYVQGKKRFKYDHFNIPRDIFNSSSPTTFKNAVSIQNTIEAYRNYLGEATAYHGDTDQLILESMGLPMPYHATFNFGGFYIDQRAHFAGFFMNTVIAEIKTTLSTYVFYLHKNSVVFNNITIKLETNLYTDDVFDQIGSISFINAGEALAIVYNIPHRFDIMLMHESVFSKQIAQFNIKWDGPITEIILSDTLKAKKPESGHDFVFDGITLLQHVDIDNELIE